MRYPPSLAESPTANPSWPASGLDSNGPIAAAPIAMSSGPGLVMARPSLDEVSVDFVILGLPCAAMRCEFAVAPPDLELEGVVFGPRSTRPW